MLIAGGWRVFAGFLVCFRRVFRLLGGNRFRLGLVSGLFSGCLFFQSGDRRFMGGDCPGDQLLLDLVRGQFIGRVEKSDGGFQAIDGSSAGGHIGFVSENQPVDVIEALICHGTKGVGGPVFECSFQCGLDSFEIRYPWNVQQCVGLVDVILEYDRIDVIGAVGRLRLFGSKDTGQGDD